MKIPVSWLSEWVGVPWPAAELGARLTMAGFELESFSTAAPEFSGVVVAEILQTVRHPEADKLQICTVAAGAISPQPLQIVCGGANARAGLKTALATVGAVMPGGMKIKPAKLRGVESFGMMPSAKELGLAEVSVGIMELPADAPVGVSLRDYLALDDQILELNVTPNRGDAMSIIGIAREVAALTGKSLLAPAIAPVKPSLPDVVEVRLSAPAACPRFVGRVIRGVNNRASTPVWMRERLRRAGVRSISPIVDVTNYVLLELGQPMHAYDLARLRGAVTARWAREGEPLTLLDGKVVEVASDVLLIADEEGAVDFAGVMGGQRTSCSEDTTDVFLEVAYFTPSAIAGRGRRYGVVTDAAQRFERGVDPAQQERAMERATALIQQIAGGQAGPTHVTQERTHLPVRAPVSLRASRLRRLLGAQIEPSRVESTLSALGMQVEKAVSSDASVDDELAGGADGSNRPLSGPGDDVWRVTPPSHRFDISIEADLIEEVARIVGYDSLPEADAATPLQFQSLPEERPIERVVLEALAARGYHEAITFAFVDPALQAKLFPHDQGIVLANAISSDLSVMRLSLWPGLLKMALENQRRQQDRVRLIEHGARFLTVAGATQEVETLSGVAFGSRLPEQWGVTRDARGAVDFFDVKADLEALFAATGQASAFTFEPAAAPACLHPGRAARISRAGKAVGWIGELHPALVRELDFTYPPVLFELDFQPALGVERLAFQEISRFPQVRRDIAVVVDEATPLSALLERVTLVAADLLQALRVFDVYRGPGVETGRKSIALGLIFQDISRTLTDEDVDGLVARIVGELRVGLNAKIRE